MRGLLMEHLLSQVEPITQQAIAAGFIPAKTARNLFASRPTTKTIRQWMKIGVHNRREKNGERIKLQNLREGSLWFTRPEWVDEFKRACEANVRRGKFR
jgi:DNA-binding CsgD family transcriptional regulator